MILRKLKSIYLSNIIYYLLIIAAIMFVSKSIASEVNLGGRLNYQFNISHYKSDHTDELDTYPIQQNLNLRLTAKAFWSSNWDSELHYQANTIYLSAPIDSALSQITPSDKSRLFNLSSIIKTDERGDNYLIIYQKLDRFSLGYTNSNFVIRLGRQALSWGNGLVFQPMDIFNPFAPTSIDTEYKTGDDMLYAQYVLAGGDDIQTVIIPRRNIENGKLEASQSSLAVKYHTLVGTTDIDILVAQHFSDEIIAVGFATDFQGAIFRGDLVNTRTEQGTSLSIVSSINYSWVWLDYNMSGFLEYFHNGYGLKPANYNSQAIMENAQLLKRIRRGELYNIGENYIATGLTVELSARWLFNPLVLRNLDDSSQLIQLQLNFDWRQNLNLIAGMAFPIANKNSEFGGFATHMTEQDEALKTRLFVQLTSYF